MPRFYIDTSDQDVFCRDEQGHEFKDIAEAKAHAVASLPDMASDQLPDGDARMFLAIVRDETGSPVLQASLSLHVMSLVPSEGR